MSPAAFLPDSLCDSKVRGHFVKKCGFVPAAGSYRQAPAGFLRISLLAAADWRGHNFEAVRLELLRFNSDLPDPPGRFCSWMSMDPDGVIQPGS